MKYSLNLIEIVESSESNEKIRRYQGSIVLRETQDFASVVGVFANILVNVRDNTFPDGQYLC